MSQTWTDDVYASGHTAETDLQNMENNFACLKSCFSGATAPANTVAGMLWYDTTNDILKLRNAANSAWLEIYDFGNDRVPDAKVTSDSISTAARKGSIVAGEAISPGSCALGYTHPSGQQCSAVTVSGMEKGSVPLLSLPPGCHEWEAPSTSWTTLVTARAYVPQTASALRMQVYDYAYYGGYVRFCLGSASYPSSTVSAAATYAWRGDGVLTVDASLKGDWQDLIIQAYTLNSGSPVKLGGIIIIWEP